MNDAAREPMPTKKATRLATARRAKGMTQTDLAVRAGVALSTVAKAEQGGSISRGSWALLALALGCHPDKIQP